MSQRSSDIEAHISLLQELQRSPVFAALDQQSTIYTARAPGRLDVMGGIGDYSGSLVLQMPIAEAAVVSVQCTSESDVVVASIENKSADRARIVRKSSTEWTDLQRADYGSIHADLCRDLESAWSAYVLGPVLVLLRETAAEWSGGLRIVVDSNVPEGKGVSSSAAVEVATMHAAAALLGIAPRGEELARWCQLAENLIVGAPCGIMDQMTSALGRANELLALRCQPASVEGFVPIPSGISFCGVDSGIRHAVSGSDYASVRCGAFMGYRIIASLAELEVETVPRESGRVRVIDPIWNGYLANISPIEFDQRFARHLPEQMHGREFLDRFGGTTDPVTRVDPERTYAIRQPTRHPIEENGRVARFRELLASSIDDDALREMGDLMAASHASYSACGLGSDGTDLLFEMVRDAGPHRGVYGAKITGGGSGGTIAILADDRAESAVADIATRYAAATNRASYVFQGSSPGACASGVVRVTI